MQGSCLSVPSIAKTALRTGPALNKFAPGCYLTTFFLTIRHLIMICQVRVALDGRHIPKHLLNDTPNPPSLKIAYSQHTDLNVKFQSHRSRFGSLHAMPCPPPHPPALSFMPSSASAFFWGLIVKYMRETRIIAWRSLSLALHIRALTIIARSSAVSKRSKRCSCLHPHDVCSNDCPLHARRDYTNPYLPVAPAHADPNMLALGIQAPLATSGNPMEGNVLLCQVGRDPKHRLPLQ